MSTKIVEYQAPKDEFLENPIGKGAENEKNTQKMGFFEDRADLNFRGCQRP